MIQFRIWLHLCLFGLNILLHSDSQQAFKWLMINFLTSADSWLPSVKLVSIFTKVLSSSTLRCLQCCWNFQSWLGCCRFRSSC